MGLRMRTRALDVKRLDSSLGHIRVGIVVPKFGFSVVRRNQLKRRLRELTRIHLLSKSSSCDLILRAKRETYDLTFDRLREEISLVGAQLA
jgi:ribonuclease P protein component